MQLAEIPGGGSWRAIARATTRLDDEVKARVPAHLEGALLTGLLALCAVLTIAGLLASAVVGGGPAAAATEAHLRGRLVATEAAGPLPTDAKAAAAPSPAPGGGNGTRERPAPVPAPPTARGPLPVGKGMWIYVPEQVEGGNVDALVARAKAVGLTHVYVRTGSSKMGFYAQDYLNRLLPTAHANGIRVYAWDFPYLDNWQDDVNRGVAAITYTTPDGQRVDGFSADIETRSQGVNVAPDTARAYGAGLRRAVGARYTLIATVPRPSPQLVTYPFAEVVESFDAIAPMIYWLNRDSGDDAAATIAAFHHFNKPLLPIGQAYNGAAEGGPAGVPSAAAIQRFMAVSEEVGATSVSFWSWQHADQQAWDAIRDAPQFRLPAAPDVPNAGQVRAYQSLLTSLGFPVAIDGAWGPATAAAVAAYQQAARLPSTGAIDAVTRDFLLRPFTPPVQPQS
ncbi:MAG: hypothetical protein QOE35_3974 [Actinomycetota bacterium]|jgi:hypothetical protein